MSDTPRACTECGKDISDKSKGAYTCSPKCRSARSRRLRRTEHHPEVTERVYARKTDVTRELVKEELRPVVRAAITEEVLRSIQDLVGLAPRVVELLAQDLESPDPQIRQKAYSLVAKYTLGHNAIVTPEDSGAGNMVVNFHMPRPDDPERVDYDAEGTAVEITQDEDRQCAFCSETKPIEEFVANSDRCQVCHDKLHAQAEALLNG